jgi:phenylalanyl-tRNA synthetase beta chain
MTMPPKALAHLITMAGLEVTDIRFIGVEGAELPWEADKIVVANILEVKPHPNADKLVLAVVDYGAGTPHTVVTGAPNLFPYKGIGRLDHPLKAVFAKEGANLYDGHKAGWVITTLKSRPVRGVVSDAMLCSEKELGISEEHTGIIFLEDEAPVGMPLCELMGDVVFDIDITPNLARCLSIVGIAREIAALTGAELHIPDPQVQAEGAAIEDRVQVTVEEPTLCPRFTAGLIENITIAPSPSWMQRRLTLAGMRPINNIVDISNYVMLEWGEPTHAFDADKVQDQQFITRLARPGERLTTLDGKDHDLIAQQGAGVPPLLVCDKTGPLALAGVMGGESSEVSDSTTRVLLEAAIWEPGQIRRTAQAFKIPSEASRRFERGVDIEVAPIAQRRALELMRTLAGGTVAQGLVDVYSQPWEHPVLDLPPSEVTRLLGIHLSAFDIADMLRSLGFACEVHNSAMLGDLAPYAIGTSMDPSYVRVWVPSFRQDVTCLADLCEEVARIYGYDNIPMTRLHDELPPSEQDQQGMLEQQVRDVLLGCGLNDVITYSLTSMESVAKLQPSAADASRYVRLSNAVSPEREYLQRSMLPTLLESLVANLYERDFAGLFEIGRVFLPRQTQQQDQDTTQDEPQDEPQNQDKGQGTNQAPDQQPVTDETEAWLPNEPHYLAIVMAGKRQPLSWLTPSTNGSDKAEVDFFDLKGVLETLLSHLGLANQAMFEPLTDDERFHPGRAARLLIAQPDEPDPAADDADDGKKKGKGKKAKKQQREPVYVEVGVFGELHPDVCERYESKTTRMLAAEGNLDTLFALVQPATYTPISRYPATLQDLAIVADTTIPTSKIASVIRKGAGDLLESLTLFDVYTGQQVGEGKRSLAYRLAFRASDRTLSDDALTKVRGKIAKMLERECKAVLRG